jgi:aldehyde:ferredoxin oxidoreductase
MLNVREGFSRKDDRPPEKWFEPMRGPNGKEFLLMDYYKTKILSRTDIEKWLDDYYKERGWDTKRGIPRKEKLTELELEELIPDLEKQGS